MNAACRMYGIPYASMINGMLKSNISLNRKVLADLAVTEPLSFRSVVEVIKPTLTIGQFLKYGSV